MKKIVFVINSLTSGGAERALSILANQFAKKGISVVVYTFDAERSDPRYELSNTIEVRKLGFQATAPLKVLRLIQKIRGEIAHERPAAVVAFMDQANIITLLAGAGLNTPTYVCEQVHPEFSSISVMKPRILSTMLNLVRNRAYRLADGIVVLAEDSVDFFPRALHEKISVIPNPIQTPPSESYEGELQRPCIVSHGRLVSQKRFDRLILAFSALAERFPDWSVSIFGEGPERESLEQIIASCGLNDRVFLKGYTSSPYAVLQNADLYVMSSDFEGFPLALGEAMACGLPVISTDCKTGPSELIQHGENGLLVPTDDNDALEAALEGLLTDASKRRQLAEKAVFVSDKYSPEKVAQSWLALLDYGDSV